MWAAAEGHTEVVDALLKSGADPNRKARVTTLTQRRNADHPTGGFTALMWAARNGHEATVRRLVQGGADMTLKNGDGASATMTAIYNDRFDLAATLVELGSDVNDGSLYTAVEMRDSTTDQFAFDGSRLRPNHPNKLTALDLISLLLDRGADPHKPFTGQFHSTSMPNSDRFDNSPFFRSAVSSDVEALKVFIAHKVDLEKLPIVVPAAAPEKRSRSGRRTSRARPRQSQRGPHRSHGNDDGRPGTGDDRRSGIPSFRGRAIPGARQPKAGGCFRLAAQGRRESQRESSRWLDALAPGRTGRQSRYDSCSRRRPREIRRTQQRRSYRA